MRRPRCSVTVIVIMDEGKLAKEEKQTSKQRQNVLLVINLKILVFHSKVFSRKYQAASACYLVLSSQSIIRPQERALFSSVSFSTVLGRVCFSREQQLLGAWGKLVLYSKDKVKDR